MREWNAEAYHRVSDPQFRWGVAVLERLPLDGDETVFDVGCGTGRLTSLLVERLPRGHVVAMDVSSNMLQKARGTLRRRQSRASFVLADASALPASASADAIFSTATFHWVLDHEVLFRSLHGALKPGGRLVAQCGGGPNIQRVHDRAAVLMNDRVFAPFFTTWSEPWEFADAETAARRLIAAGFDEVRTSLEPTPVVQPDAAAFAAFLTSVICRPHLARLPAEAHAMFVGELTRQAAGDDPAFELDYWRLNIEARRSA
jgi:trans-aconitate 2-methyltransferase